MINLASGTLVIGALTAGAVALDALSRRTIRRYEDLSPESMPLPGSRFWVRGEAVHYVERGTGFPIILVHGFGGSTLSFRHTLPALAKLFRVLAVDLPGFGYSGRGQGVRYSQSGWADLLAAFLHRQGIKRAVLVGHSLGGAVVQRLAVAHPELVERLILVSSVSAGEPPAGATFRPFMPAVRAMQALMAAKPALFHGMVKRVVYDPAFMTDGLLRAYLDPARVPGSAAAFRRMLLDRRGEIPLDLAAISAPTLLLWGERDRTVKLNVAERLLGTIPGARLTIVSRSAHLPLEEQPESCNQLILDFIADLAKGQPVRSEAASPTDGAL